VSKLVASAIALGLWCASALANDAPFTPVPDVPDYIATFAVKPSAGPSRIDSRTVTHRGGWVRIDSEFNRHRATTFARIGDALTVRIQGDPASVPSYTQLTILRSAKEHRSPGWNYDSFKTGEQDVIVGEPCEIWNTARTDHPSIKTELKRLSCVTQDGIELRYRFVATAYDGTFAEATSLVRRSVDAPDVLPPSDLFDLKSWLGEAAPAADNQPGDATVTMEMQPRGGDTRNVKTRIVRRHHPWTREEDVDADGRRKGSIVNTSQKLKMNFEIDANGQFTTLILSKLSAGAVRAMEKPRVALGKQETVLGEICTWYDLAPSLMDAGLAQCRTEDGLALKERRTSFGSAFDLVATRLERGAVALSDVSPADMLARRNWGLPD
jgi:hypothetical protein